MGLLPVKGIAGKAGATYLDPREPDFRLDFLTPLRREGERAYEHAQLGVTLQPLKFIEYILEDVQQAALLSGDRTVVANVPGAARYAVHKLLVYGEREGSFAAKAGKDLAQAYSLLAFLEERRRWDVEAAWKDLVSRGRGWATRAHRGLRALERAFPELGATKWLLR